MTALPRRRRADAFDAWLTTALDGPGTAAPTGPAEREFGDLRPLLLALQEQEPVAPRPEFVTGLRTALMERARTELPQAAPAGRAVRSPAAATSASTTAGTRARHPRRTGRERWVAAAVTTLALSGVFGGSAIAAQGALPGDPLYPLKRVIEDAQVGLQGGALDRGEAQLAHAADRLDELGRLEAAGATDTALLGRTVDAFTGQTEEATATLLQAYAADPRPATVAGLRDFAASSTDTLEQLRTTLPTRLTGALDDALDVVAGIDAQALDACPTCSALPALALLDPAAAPAPAAPSGTATAPRDPAPSDAPTTGRTGRTADPAPGTGRGGDRRPDGAGATDRPGATPSADVPDPGGLDDPAGTGGTPTAGGGNGGRGLVGGALGTVGGVVDGLRGDKAGQGDTSGPRSGGGNGGAGGSGGTGGSGGGLVGGLLDGLDGATTGLGDALGGS